MPSDAIWVLFAKLKVPDEVYFWWQRMNQGRAEKSCNCQTFSAPINSVSKDACYKVDSVAEHCYWCSLHMIKKCSLTFLQVEELMFKSPADINKVL
jgi:hypothetical protein